ncbi:hypothetical protein [Winogradskyella alexanderae]|uniref:Uncharacterized protein n=1 Tax=Winogradskyella alexanderae TaxID=2877123 RepID=A0ABS7XQ64_9FLAO|nr:hypothetical protein [Winogradskyella alexanderae]MCA0132145.1 hypothetical protein [Winogradskyella alexanderae]
MDKTIIPNMGTQKVMNYSVAILTAIHCIISIADNDIYRDGEWANAQWLGQDIITLVIALPLLLISIRKGIEKNKEKWKILNCGVLLYFAYTYSFYVFVAKLTYLYFFQASIFGLSLIGFVISCIGIFNHKCSFNLPSRNLKMIIVIYLSLIALMLSFIWLSDIIAHITNPAHKSDTPNGEAPLIIYTLDLAVIIPLMFTSAILLYQKTNWGYLLSGIILTKTSTLGFALMAMSLSMYLQDLNPDYFLIILWCIIGLIGTILTLLFLNKLKIKENTESNKEYKK